MKLDTQKNRIHLPSGIRGRLHQFQRRVHVIKMAEGVFAAIFGLALSYCILFVLDRIWNTPSTARWFILLSGSLGFGVFLPLKFHRWVWCQRKLKQVAKLLRKSFPRLGDQLLGIIELATNDQEQERSSTLVKAAMIQVDESTRDRDFNKALPNARHIRWAVTALAVLVLGAGTILVVPAAGWNALYRWAMPWKNIDRYTFAQLGDLPDRLIVPYAEPFVLEAGLKDSSEWKPEKASARYLDQDLVRTSLNAGRYTFNIPPQRNPGNLIVSAGDDRSSISVKPLPRPELTSLKATVELPAYLRYSKPVEMQARSSSISILRDSRARIEANASRELNEASMDGKSASIQENTLVTPWMHIGESQKLTFTWTDVHGLAAKEPLDLQVRAVSDDPPAIQCLNSLRERVVLDEEVVTFEISATDDFGIQRVGLEWEGVPDPLNNPKPQNGEKITAGGAPELRELEAQSAFSAKAEGIRPQVLRLRAFVEDYLPGRKRVYSASYTLYILNPQEHAIWLVEQMDKWRRQSLEVYERELQLNERNETLRALPSAELDKPKVRREIERQASSEQANAQQLQGLTEGGEQLLKQAARNPEFKGKDLEKWAGILQTLKDIAANRMPSVSDLLREASDAPASQPPQPRETGKQPSEPQDATSPGEQAQTAQNNESLKPPDGQPQPPPPGQIPSISDIESTLAETKDPSEEENSPSASGPGKLSLPTTVVPGGEPPPEESPAGESVAQAVDEQNKLLEEFAKVAEELNEILKNLEGSTFIKRLKAASRHQVSISGDLNEDLVDGFGIDPESLPKPKTEFAVSIANRENDQSDKIYVIMEDLEAFAQRMQDQRFITVLEDMKETEVVTEVANIGKAVQGNNRSGQSMAVAEFWADELDRWADELLDPEEPPGPPPPPGQGQCPSLPPSLILEVMRILQEEVELRESTRSLQQAKSILETQQFEGKAQPLEFKQVELASRTDKVVTDIHDLPNGPAFGKEMELLRKVSHVMDEASDILSEPDTGSKAIAAETEAIELLLQAKRSMGGGGGSGMGPPGMGGEGTTNRSALALVGLGKDEGAQVQERQTGQSTGVSGLSLPAEFRSGLDAYFNALEKNAP